MTYTWKTVVDDQVVADNVKIHAELQNGAWCTIPLPGEAEERAKLAQAIVGDDYVVVPRASVAHVPLVRFESEELMQALADGYHEAVDDDV